MRDEPGWITFTIDGRYAYPSTGDVIEAASKKIITTLTDETETPVMSEKMLEIQFQDDKVVHTGDQFGVGADARDGRHAQKQNSSLNVLFAAAIALTSDIPLLTTLVDSCRWSEATSMRVAKSGESIEPQTSNVYMITVGMNYHVLPGKQLDFEEKFAGVIDALKAAPGHTNSTLWKDVSDDASYLITSEWSDETAFQEFIRSDAFRAVTNWGKEQILSGRPQHKVYKH